jgi:hypothetical protein
MMGGNLGFSTFGTGMPGGYTLSPHPFMLLGEPDNVGGSFHPGPDPSAQQLTAEDMAALQQFWDTWSQN